VVHEATGEAVVADDSGISAVGLGGRPGIHSARYGGEGATDEENLAKLLREVKAAGEDRRAFYTCALALVEEDGTEHLFEARWDGRLIEEPRGEGGFGYDPAFVADGQKDGRTASELSDAEKNEISHRGRAARMLAAHLAGEAAGRPAR
jgi:XTP/dITP diphosphohydrolase